MLVLARRVWPVARATVIARIVRKDARALSRSSCPPSRALALRSVGLVLIPATLSKALCRPCLVYPLASLDISGQWPISCADASPNEDPSYNQSIYHFFLFMSSLFAWNLNSPSGHSWKVLVKSHSQSNPTASSGRLCPSSLLVFCRVRDLRISSRGHDSPPKSDQRYLMLAWGILPT
jgi:hypothetical protein